MKPEWWDKFFRRVCELPDRSSPDDEPDAIVATEQELLNAYLCTMEELAEAQQPCKHPNAKCVYDSDDGEFERWACPDCGERWGVEIAQ